MLMTGTAEEPLPEDDDTSSSQRSISGGGAATLADLDSLLLEDGSRGRAASVRSARSAGSKATSSVSEEAHTFAIEMVCRPVIVNYRPELMFDVVNFFAISEGEELQAQALDQLAQVSSQSSVTIRELIQEQKVAKIDFVLERLTINLPFQAFNRHVVDMADPERRWTFEIRELRMRQKPFRNLEDLYQHFLLDFGELSLLLQKKGDRSSDQDAEDHEVVVLDPFRLFLHIEV
jgi:hypothetical protein